MPELALDALEARGLIRVAAISPELEYLFRHALLQDAAYESLLKQERRSLHRLVGEALEELYPERQGELAAVLARHFELAGQADKGIAYLLAAARFAGQRNALVEAHDMFTRASALLPPLSADDPPELRHRRLEIEFGKLKAGFSFQDEATQMAMVPWLIEEADRTDDLALAAQVHLHVALLRSYRGERYDTSEPLRYSLDRVRQIAGQLNDPSIDALPKSLIALFEVFSGQIERGVERLTEVAPVLARKRDFIGSSFALVALAIGLARLGRFEEAAAAARKSSETAEEGDVIAKIDAMIGETVVRSVRGDLEEAVTLGKQCIQLAEDAGAAACVVSSAFFVGDAYMRQGEYALARAALERSGSIADVSDQKVFRPSVAAYLRATAANLGGVEVTGLTFDEALAEARQVNDHWSEANVIWKRAEAESKQAAPDVEQMLADYRTAAAGFEAMAARPYLARVLRDWANALDENGRADEAADLRRRALELFEAMGITREANEVRAALD